MKCLQIFAVIVLDCSYLFAGENDCKLKDEIFKKQELKMNTCSTLSYKSRMSNESSTMDCIIYIKNNDDGTKFERTETKDKSFDTDDVEIINNEGIWELRNGKAVNVKKVRDKERMAMADEAVNAQKMFPNNYGRIEECKIEDGEYKGIKCYIITVKATTKKEILIQGIKALQKINDAYKYMDPEAIYKKDSVSISIFTIDKSNLLPYLVESYDEKGVKQYSIIQYDYKINQVLDEKLFSIPKNYKKEVIEDIKAYQKYIIENGKNGNKGGKKK
ncbi:MAG: hypothetical protein ABH873_09370 [Candidatus Firestonebacteria bacterium]